MLVFTNSIVNLFTNNSILFIYPKTNKNFIKTINVNTIDIVDANNKETISKNVTTPAKNPELFENLANKPNIKKEDII